MPTKTFQNRLLSQMSNEDFDSLGSFEPVMLSLREQLEPSGEGAVHIYFLEDGIASVVVETDGKPVAELGVVGREGFVGHGVVYGDVGTPFQVFMQAGGMAHRFDRKRVEAAIAERSGVRSLLLRYVRSFSIQVATTALANGRSSLDERLCRWLLMVSDRIGPSFNITHEFISVMLAVRRSGVTLAVQVLEGKGLIRATRGSISILDRGGLITAANGAYGFAEREYERLLGAQS